MKPKKLFCTLLSVMLCASSLSSCARKHEHSWEIYIAKQPTCTEKGILERVCKECSKQEFEEIVKTDHRFVNGICQICGKIEENSDEETTDNTVTLTTENIGYTIDKLYELSTEKFGYKYKKEDFIKELTCGYVETIYEDTLKLVHFDIIGTSDETSECSLAFDVDREAISAPLPDLLKTIYRVSFQSDLLTILYTDGTQLTDCRFDSVFLNAQNQVAITNGTTATFIGKISDGVLPENNAELIYQAGSNGYSVIGAVNKNAETLEIPLTFHGKPIIEVCNHAFYGMTELRSLKIGANVKTIGRGVVNACPSLKYVCLPASVQFIANYAFYFCADSCSIFIEGSENDCNFSILWKRAKTSAYYKNEWHLNENGIPVANNN